MWVAVARLEDVPPQSARVARAGGREIALVHGKDGLFAIDNACPHAGGSLGEGVVQGNCVTCPLHGWQFDGPSGTCLTERRAPQERYPVRVEKGEVLIEVPDPAPSAAAGAAAPAAEWVAVADAAEMRPGAVRVVKAGQQAVVLAATDQGVFALANACCHEGGPLGEGTLEGKVLTCPWHNWQFDCRTGKCLTDKRFSQRTYETKIEGGKVWVRPGAAPPPSAKTPEDPATALSSVEQWKRAKHGIDVWPDVLRYAREKTPMDRIEVPDLERMKWYGFFYRKNNDNDRYMVRVRIPGCEMTSEQARALAYIAYESGYSILDVTTRGNVQIQGLTIDKLPAVRAALEKVGLTARQSGHDNVRNVTSHPYSGIDPEELLDTRDLARQIQDLVIGDREFSDLPRKFNIALVGRPSAPAHAWTQDLCFVATRGPDGSIGFRLLLGGNQGQAPRLSWAIPVFVRPGEVREVSAAVLRTFRECGYRHNRHQVRFRFLIERLGPDGVLLEIEKRLGRELARLPQPPPPPAGEEDFVGWFKQKQEDLWALGVCVPVGRLTWDQMEGLALVARQYGAGTLRTTYDQNLVLPGIPSAVRSKVGYAIARYGLSYEPDSWTRNTVACTGKQFCNLAVTETKGYAYRLIEELRRRKVPLHGIHLALSGCPSSCAMSYTADIGLKGVKIRRGLRVVDAFDVYLGGGCAGEIQMGVLYQKAVPFDQLPELLERVVREFYLRRGEGDTFSAYWRGRLRGYKAEKPKEDLPRWTCGSCGYLHVAEDPPPFCPVCAALRARFEPASDEAPAARPAPAGPWACGSCGHKPEGEPPELCPVCGAARAEFRRGAPAAAARPAPPPAGKRVLIIGGSVAGHTAAQTARELDPDCRITLVTDERHSFYNRLNLTRFLADEVKREDLFDYKSDWYAERRVEILTGARVIGLDPVKKTALLEEGRELAFDACVLAHGSSAAVPPFWRPDVHGVFLLRTLEDVEGILGRARPGVRAAVIGGGVLGLEAAYGIVKRGGSVKVFELAPRLMPRQLDRVSAGLFAEKVREKGIEAHCGVSVRELSEGALELADGRRFEFDLAVVSTGIRPNIDWVKRSGLHCARGVLVDDRMQTSAEGIFAAGDVVEWRGQVVGLWGNAIEQAKVAAAGAVGKLAFFQGFLPVTILKCLGIPLVSMGEILEDGDGVTSHVRHDPAAGTYRRVIFRRGIPVGGILLGTSAGMGEMRKLIEGGLELEKLKKKVAPEEAVAVP
jgi:ferredoxin-nitrite reductase